MLHRLLITAGLLLLAGCQPAGTADNLILTNAKIYTLGEPAWAETMVIAGERIVYVGSATGAQDFQDQNSNVIDLQGRMIMPGIIDAHLHPLDGAMKILYQCNFAFTATPEEIQSTVAACVEASGDRQWVVGGQWDSNFFVTHPLESPRGLLDEVSADKAVFLLADSGHDAWLNSKGLELAGVTDDSLNPEGGTIGRDAQGKANGLLLEKASYRARRVLPVMNDAEYVRGAQELMRIANRFGVTAMKDASADEPDLRALATLSDRGELSAHMASAMVVHDDDWSNDQFDLQRLLRLRDQFARTNVDTRFVKIFMDGVPTASRTAAMLANYLPVDEAQNGHSGDVHFDLEQLQQMLVQLDGAGFTVKIHTAGDRSVRIALDAIAQVRELNGSSGLRHELAHAGFIDPADIGRFRDLQAVADLSPYLWHPSPIIDSVIGAVGPRGEQYWPIRDLLASQAPLLAGSDWPAAVASMNPWIGMEAMVTRADPHETVEGTLWPEQAISLAEAIRILTLDGARALRIEQATGSLEVGKLADFIVLEHNLFDLPPNAISDTAISATFFQGDLVYAASNSPLAQEANKGL